MLPALLLGFALALVVTGLAYAAGALNPSGAVAAVIEGTIIFGFGGIPAAALLLAFFISSSLLSRLFKGRKQSMDEKFSKGSRRDAGQVLANGGIASGFILLHAAFPGAVWPWVGYAASLAAVNADTWATELGVLSRSQPILITTGRPVAAGSSGAISRAGVAAGLAGAALIALISLLPGSVFPGTLPALLIISGCGLAGALVDSILGATVQVMYYCPVDCKETERHPLHSCGATTTYLRGWGWLNNDWVNVACALSGAGLALALWSIHPAWFPSSAASRGLPSSGEITMSFPISSTSFDEGGLIPKKYSCDGANSSPTLSWSDLPANTHSLALIADDPDAPGGTFTHWVLYNIIPASGTLSEGLPKERELPALGTQGVNSFGRVGYDGPCPPAGPAHRYYFTLYALDNAPTLPAGLSAAALRKAIQGHVLAEAQWVGKYAR